MSDTNSIPRYFPPFTEEDVSRRLAVEHVWFECGTELFQAAEALADRAQTDSDSGLLRVGKPIASYSLDKDRSRRHKEIVAAMLYAMAVECWLKGILILSVPRESRSKFEEINEWLVEQLKSANKPADTYADTERVLDVLKTRDGQERLEALDEAQKKEDKERRGKIERHKRHDLVELANDAGLKPHLNIDDRKYLRFLSEAIVLGRYPARFRRKQAITWKGNACDRARWDSLNVAICKRYYEASNRVAEMPQAAVASKLN